MKRLTTILAGLLLFGGLGFAQGINAQVQVTNDYRSGIGELNKLGLAMTVPDTAYRFDYSFDYSVFDSPYLGAYEFSPYSVRITPEPSVRKPSKLYLRAGTGYSFNPLLQAVYTPVSDGSFGLSLYQDLHGYLGDYWQVNDNLRPVRSRYFGADMSENLGAAATWRGRRSVMSLALDYKGVFNRDERLTDFYNAGKFTARIKSNSLDEKRFYYDLALSAQLASDRASAVLEPVDMVQASYGADAVVGPVLNRNFRLLVDVSARHDKYYNIFKTDATWVSAVPKFYFSYGGFDLMAGAALDYCSGLFVHPVAKARLGTRSGVINIEAGLKGGTRLSSFSGLKDAMSRFNASFVSGITTVSVENINLYAGFDGHIGSFFQYALKGGYASVRDELALGLRMSGTTPVAALLPSGYDYAYADLDLSWHSERFDLLADLDFRRNNASLPEQAFSLPMFKGSLGAVYNIRRRIFVGASCEGVTERHTASGFKLPGYADLSVYGEYRLPSGLGFWLRGGNLLNMPLQRIPGYAERGINLSVGISLNL